jgi:hypothetical protein
MYRDHAGAQALRQSRPWGDIVMSDLVAIIYPSEAKAEQVRQRLFDLQKEIPHKV